ncbi:MAG: hypothetical protein FWF04_02060, partial [Clostridiales bacterium]|nr:hypothetical protein [Clostridiales bacterium]
MSIRIKAAAIIIMIAFTVTMATFPLNPIISKNGLDGAIGRDFFLASEIKDNFFAAGSSLDASFIFLAVGLLAAFIIFGLAARSFNKIKEQKAEMEKLNEKVLQQATQVKDECECAKIMLNAMPLACHIWDKNYQ